MKIRRDCGREGETIWLQGAYLLISLAPTGDVFLFIIPLLYVHYYSDLIIDEWSCFLLVPYAVLNRATTFLISSKWK